MDDHEDYFLDEYDKKDSKTPDRVVDFRQAEPEALPEQKKKRKGCGLLSWFLIIVFIGLSTVAFFRYFNPYVTEARATGYITSVEKRGILFKTFEGKMLTQTPVPLDSGATVTNEFIFSIPDDALARKMQEYQNTGKKVTVVYEKYYGSLFWRGATPNIAVELLP